MQATPVSGVELLRAHFVRHTFERHSHEGWCLGVTLAGNQTFRCRGATTTSHHGDLIVFRPDEAHDGHGEDASGFRYAMLYLPESLIDSWLKQSGAQSQHVLFHSALIHDPAGSGALMRSVRALTQDTESLRGESLLCESVLDVFARHAGHAPKTVHEQSSAKWLAAVREYLDTHYAENVTVDDLAHVAQVSRVHLTRAFSQVFGVPPHVQLNSRRLQAAKGLLARGVPMADVAARVGFSDQSHLVRRFKGSFGVTPGAWQRQMIR